MESTYRYIFFKFILRYQDSTVHSLIVFSLFATGVIDTGDKFAGGIYDTSDIGGKFVAGVVDTGGAS